MSILLTGGTGKSALATADHLAKHNVPFLCTSRRGQGGAPAGTRAVKFDWNDPSTFAPVFDNHAIRAILLIAPQADDVATPMIPFIDMAKVRGVNRFVLVAGGSVKLGGPWTGQVYKHLDDIGVEYAVLRPNWFNENFLDDRHVRSIREEGKFYSACGDGRSPMTACDDIGEVAYRALTSETPPEHDYLICGPENISYSDVAAEISEVIGKKVEHVTLSKEEMEERMRADGMEEFNVALCSRLEEMTKNGAVAELFPEKQNQMEQALGRKPLAFGEWAARNKAAWL